MSWLVLGATGALGQTVMAALVQRGETAIGAARRRTDKAVDVVDAAALTHLLEEVRPQTIINCAAIVDLAACEREPGHAYAVNARPAAVLAQWSQRARAKLVQISTDQFFAGLADVRTRHREDAPVIVTHEYARTKYAAEQFAALAPGALIVRTNMTSAVFGRGKPPFGAWALEAVSDGAPLTLFTDYFCSTLDVESLAQAVLDLAQADAAGVVNVAARDVASKAEFVHALADGLGVTLDWAAYGLARERLGPHRPLTLGLDVSKAESLLGRQLPDSREAAFNLVSQWRRAHALEPAI